MLSQFSPKLTPHDFVGQQGHADVGAEVADAWNGVQLIANLGGNAPLFRDRGAGLGDAMRKEVAFLELGEQRLAQVGA